MTASKRVAVIAAIASGLVGCAGDVTAPGDGGTPDPDGGGQSPFGILGTIRSSTLDKLDLLLMVDNSRSMADKQRILATTIPDLVQGLVNPPCVDPNGVLSGQQPVSPLDPCPAGTRRRFTPITDIHIGVVTSSIGGHGSDACPDSETFSCPGGATNTTNNDHGHLVSRADPCAGGATPTYQNQGFLAWDLAGKDNPPGEASIGMLGIDPTTGNTTTVSPGLMPSLKDMVYGVGQVGCGYESSMESWYRFLVDPDPYNTLTFDPNTGKVNPQGIDTVLLQQRADFLRPGSLLAIIGLTDENDCSIKEFGQFFYAAQQRDPANPNTNFHLPKPRSECAVNPNDDCCRSCGQAANGCPPDPNCNATSLDAKTDDVNLRCWDQKRRFGIDFLYPIDRYVTALTSNLVPNRAGELVPNPIFSDLDPSDADWFIRDSNLVLLSYVVGVPWQDLARDPTDAGKGFKDANELAELDSKGHSTWDYVIGDPANYVPPLDPHMIESISPRSGANPFTGDVIAPPSTAPGPGPDKINGHEYTPGTNDGVQVVPDDLQYACIFDLPVPRDCADPTQVSCDCSDPKNDNPLCERQNPADPASPRTKQVRAKAYPGIRQLSLIKALGRQGIAASICPAQISDLAKPSYGYRPAIQAVLDRLTPIVDGGCLPKQLPADAGTGQISCAVVEARNSGQNLDANACQSFCQGLPGRIPLTGAHAVLRDAALSSPVAQFIGPDCVCEIPQLGGTPGCSPVQSPLGACQCDPSPTPTSGGQPVDGWCYVDTAQGIGSPEVVQSCPETEKREIRFVGTGNPAPGAVVLIACTQ